MNMQIMEGLLGASSNIKLSGTPMSVYRRASAGGDTEKMKRALSYTGECMEKAAMYQEKLDKGMKAEAKAEREKAKLEQKAAIEKNREEGQRTEEGTKPERSRENDLVQISEAATYTPAGEITAIPSEAEPTVSFTA